jgi:hypothetical protein
LFAYQLHLNQRYIDTLADALSEEAGVDPRQDVFARSVAAMLTAANYDVARMAIRSGRDKLIGVYCIEVIDLAETLRRDAIAAHAAKELTQSVAPVTKKRASPAKTPPQIVEGVRPRSPKRASFSGKDSPEASKKRLGRKRDL